MVDPSGKMCTAPVGSGFSDYPIIDSGSIVGGGSGSTSSGGTVSCPEGDAGCIVSGTGTHRYIMPVIGTGSTGSGISLGDVFSGCPPELANVDIGFLSFLNVGSDGFTVPYLGFVVPAFHPFSGLACPFKAVVNLYNMFYSQSS